MAEHVRALFLIAIVGCVEQTPTNPPTQSSGESFSKTEFAGMSTRLAGAPATPLACSVSDVVALGSADETATVMAACDRAIAWPCWYAAPDASCASGLAIVVVHTEPAATGSITQALCEE
jgi:hypothetical protein